MEIGILIVLGLIGFFIWGLEGTKFGKKLADKLYNYFMNK